MPSPIPKAYKTIRRSPVKVMPDGREVCCMETLAGREEYRWRTDLMVERQGYRCAICGDPLSMGYAQFDHEIGRGMGGGHRDDRLIVDGKRQNGAVHPRCNLEKGSKRTPYLIQ